MKEKNMNPLNIAYSYLSYSDRTRHEMEVHLRKKGCTAEQIDDTIKHLIELKLLDDMSYCLRFVENGIDNSKGPLRIERELLDKGISKEIIQNVLEDKYDRDLEFDKAKDYANKVMDRELIKSSEREKARVAKRLYYKGFHPDVIYSLINRL